jgi:hypothetical protein
MALPITDTELKLMTGSLAYATTVKRAASLLAVVAPWALWVSARPRTVKALMCCDIVVGHAVRTPTKGVYLCAAALSRFSW